MLTSSSGNVANSDKETETEAFVSEEPLGMEPPSMAEIVDEAMAEQPPPVPITELLKNPTKVLLLRVRLFSHITTDCGRSDARTAAASAQDRTGDE